MTYIIHLKYYTRTCDTESCKADSRSADQEVPSLFIEFEESLSCSQQTST
jgi:hypothetical protein